MLPKAMSTSFMFALIVGIFSMRKFLTLFDQIMAR